MVTRTEETGVYVWRAHNPGRKKYVVMIGYILWPYCSFAPCFIFHYELVLAGLGVETKDKGVNGCIVKSITPGGAVQKDGRLKLGDYIVSINNESLRRITNSQAKAILRRTSLLSNDIR